MKRASMLAILAPSAQAFLCAPAPGQHSAASGFGVDVGVPAPSARPPAFLLSGLRMQGAGAEIKCAVACEPRDTAKAARCLARAHAL